MTTRTVSPTPLSVLVPDVTPIASLYPSSLLESDDKAFHREACPFRAKRTDSDVWTNSRTIPHDLC
jgi:hypothetical protein